MKVGMMTKRFLKSVAAAVVVFALVPGLASAETVITVVPSSAPNAYGSPSFSNWSANAVYALENGLASRGTAGQPTYYSQAPATISLADNIVTGFNSWKGQASPAAPFQSELGNRLHFGVHIVSSTEFSISQLSFVMDSDDAADSLDYAYNGGYNYGDYWVGINYGLDNTKGTVDDVRITSGAATQLIDELVGRGSGNAWDVYDTAAYPGATLQEKIDNEVARLGSSGNVINFSGTYTLTGFTGISGTASVAMTPVTPTPVAASAGLVLMGMVATKRRRAC